MSNTKLLAHENKDNSGRYSKAPACDCCGKPTNEAERYTDTDVCGSSDGPGFYLCHRKRCIAKRDAMTLPQLVEHYTAQRAKNDAPGIALAMVGSSCFHRGEHGEIIEADLTSYTEPMLRVKFGERLAWLAPSEIGKA